MPKPVNGQVSWPESLEEKYAHRRKLVEQLNNLQAEISALELVMLMQQIPLWSDHDRTTGESQSS